jgi:hypothetical protein
MPTTYATDILPKFRPNDIACMTPRGIQIGESAWMCDPAAAFGFDDHGNARHVFQALSDGVMPPDGAWSPDWIATYQSWITGGFQP